MEISPVTRKEHFLARAAGDEDALELQPITREEHLLQNIIDAIEQGGAAADPNAVHYTADAGKSDSEKAQARRNIGISDLVPDVGDDDEGKVLTAYDDGTAGWELHPYPESVSGATPTISPIKNYQYKCGELTSLTISNPPATGAYVIKFDSGATATTTTFPASIYGLESFAAEANTHYEINVEDNYALVASWPISGGGGA